MAGHLQVLARLLRERNITQGDVALKLGYNSPSAISMILGGKRGIGRKELLIMCELAGYHSRNWQGKVTIYSLLKRPKRYQALR